MAFETFEVAFRPLQYVTVAVHGLNYRGRITRVIFDYGPKVIYGVEYTNDAGEFNTREFYEEELEAMK